MPASTSSQLPSTSTLLIAALDIMCLVPKTRGTYIRTLLEPSTLWPALVSQTPESTESFYASEAVLKTVRRKFLPSPTPRTGPMRVDSLSILRGMHRSMKLTCFFFPIQCTMELELISAMDSTRARVTASSNTVKITQSLFAPIFSRNRHQPPC